MTEVFVDSNVFLRFYARDNENERAIAKKIFRRAAAGEISLVTGPPVFFEVAWALRAWAKWPNGRILEALEAMTAVPNMKLLDKDAVVGAILLAKESGQAFGDAYIAVTAASRGASIATFSRGHFGELDAEMYDMERD